MSQKLIVCLSAGLMSKHHWLYLLLMATYVNPSAVSNWPSMTICADNSYTDLMCAKGQQLVLANAQYGLKNASTPCPRDGDFTQVACLRDVTAQLQTLCFGNNSCNISLHSTSLKTTDPCVATGTPFLTFNYTCLPDNLLAELACGALSMSNSDLGGLLSSADYPRTFPRRSDICVQTLQLLPEQSLSLNVIDVDMTPGKIVIACGNEIIIGIHHDNIGTCHCQPLRPSEEILFRGNVTFRLFERTTPSRGVLFEYKVQRRSTYVERAAVVCGGAFTFPGEPENRITLQDYRNITWPNSAFVSSPEFKPTTAGTGPISRTVGPTEEPQRPIFGDTNKVTPTFKTATANVDGHNSVLKPTAESTIIHHYHYHKKTVAIAVGTSVSASLFGVLLVILIFVLCRRKKSEPATPTEMTPRGETPMPSPLDCSFGNEDMEGLDNPTYGILP